MFKLAADHRLRGIEVRGVLERGIACDAQSRAARHARALLPLLHRAERPRPQAPGCGIHAAARRQSQHHTRHR